MLTLFIIVVIITFVRYQKVVSETKGVEAMKIGYARVSTSKQELTNQVDTLKQAGAERIYQETMSGSRKDRPKLQEALNALKAGDTFIVTKADRIARSLSQLESTVTDLTARGVTVEVLNMGKFTAQSMDNPMNKLLFNVLGAFAEFERSMINERTQEGIRAAREKGVKFGRKSKQWNIEGSLLHAIKEVNAGRMTQNEAADFAGCSIATFKRRLKEYREQEAKKTAE